MIVQEVVDELLRENATAGGIRYPTCDSIFWELIRRLLEQDKHEHHPVET